MDGGVVKVEFHVARAARDKYAFDDMLFSSTGNVVLANFPAAHLFAQKMNEKRDLTHHPEQSVLASEINSLGLLDEMLHQVIALYRRQVNPRVFYQAMEWLENRIGANKTRATLERFVEFFPPVAVYRGEMDGVTYLAGETEGVPNRIIVLEELLVLRLANLNSAFAPFRELFDDTILGKESAYMELVASFEMFFGTQPTFGPSQINLFALLRQPALERPDSLQEQLRFMASTWGFLLGDFVLGLLRGADFLTEETKPVFSGPPPTEVVEYTPWGEDEIEQFSPDLHWMPNLVLIAKSSLVWLDQLSRKYQRRIHRLDEIPDAELDALAQWGFTGLWLIGIWQRSGASKKVKRMCGNPEAESSAYSLFDYQIAEEIGGHAALQNLKERCSVRGIRLGCDMVPNHTGIDSLWIRQHPDWFISLPFSPFPNYGFNGPNLSDDQRYCIQIEDKYFDRTDAAVVFRREDTWTGDVRFIYHGNDGTSTPWNDTAQLDYLKPEVREAVIQKIIDVVRMFPIVRFDAAMTLAKKHFHRLWYPEAGGGGDIPSRSQYGMNRAELDKHMPNEFWREVVDRVAAEVPDSLLLAEAFWLMEGYFVRTLGMHRVYNSAFMNMLKNEENAKYRQTVINTLQFDPEVLKRHVNFLNNPDEDTAAEQFGDGDKYFGVCLMMVTMPGLPMFGHGQIEGFREKYGMEYRRAYWEEEVNTGLVERHAREIFPFLKKRYLFAQVEGFLFYDFVGGDGQIDENVFAYSNRLESEFVLVVYHNKFSETRGWVRASVPFAQRKEGQSALTLVQKSLRQGLSLTYDATCFLITRDKISGLEYIRNCKQLCNEGFYFELKAYGRQVLSDMYQVQDNAEGHYRRLCDYLAGRGVPSIAEEMGEIRLKPLLDKVDILLCPEAFQSFCASRVTARQKGVKRVFLRHFRKNYEQLLKQVNGGATRSPTRLKKILREAMSVLESVMRLHALAERFPFSGAAYRDLVREVQALSTGDAAFWIPIYSWLIISPLARLSATEVRDQAGAHLLNEWLLGRRVDGLAAFCSLSGEEAAGMRQAVRLLLSSSEWLEQPWTQRLQPHLALVRLLQSGHVRTFLKINRFDGVLWFNRERFQIFTELLFVVMAAKITMRKHDETNVAKALVDLHAVILKWRKAAAASEYRLEKLLGGLVPKSSQGAPRKRSKPAGKRASRKTKVHR